MKMQIAVLLLLGTTAAYGQTAPAIAHAGQIVSAGSWNGATQGFIECTNGCSLGTLVPDAATLAAIQYVDSNMLGGMFYATWTGYKQADVCIVNHADPVSTVCRTYISNPVSSASQVATSWQAQTNIYGQPFTFLSWDVCLAYVSHGTGVRDKVYWPEQCGSYPAATRYLPAPPTPFQSGVQPNWTCVGASGPAGWDGFITCSAPG